MASITVDIQAKVVGYEASLKAMKDAFSKIDPGSEIGKSLEKAIKYAEGQLKNLNKNLTPKASSDTQIDSIIEKTNRAGEAIQEVSALMQKVTFGDIDFSSFENSIGKLMGTLSDLESELDARVSKRLRETITNSTELTESFSKLNIDVKDKSAGEIFEIVSEKAKKAAEDTEAARVKLETAQKDLNSQQEKLDKLESNPIYNKDSLKQDLQNISVEYTKTFDEIKTKIQEGLRDLLGSDNVQANKLMENFTNGLSPQTLKDHLMQLKNELQKELSENNSAKDIYTALLGDEGKSGNAQAITTKLLSGLNQFLPKIKEELQSKVQEFISSLTNKEAGQITTLISSGDIENAVKNTIRAIERAYDSVKGAVDKQRAKVSDAMKGQETAQADFGAAQKNQQYIEGIQDNLQKQIDDLHAENSQLQEQIKQLTKEIQEKKEAEAGSIRKTGLDSGSKTNNLKVSADEARMYRTELEQVQAKEKLIGKIEGVVQRWFSIYAAVRMVGNAIRSVISTVQELDKTITEIAIVTDMTQNDLWGQMKSYTDMARQYASSISGVYKVSQLYYQQGLQTADVMALTEQTLKMARISGLDYAKATDYMTNAVRSFKMEMTDAQRVVDVYSEIAASSATSTTELAVAMSKTASSAAAVGASFENTTAMMAVMIEATREAPENIGSALKSIISRYGEMKADPTALIDSEGQEISLNKVDKALQSVGISIQDANHQFRDFDDVITELAGKWDTIDKNTQRYIATIMAGNRQQSRFLALVSNGERLAELSEAAANSEDAATLQVLKTMDSIEAKSQQLKTSLQSLYTSTGIQNLFKGFLDIGNQIVKTFTQMPTVFGAPIPAILKIGTTFASLANVVTTVFGMIKAKTQAQIAALNGQEQVAAQERVSIANFEESEKEILEMKRLSLHQLINGEISQSDFKLARQEIEIYRQKLEEEKQLAQQANAQLTGGAKGSLTKQNAGTALGLNIAGVALSTISGAISDKTQGSKFFKGLTGIAGSTASMAGMGLMMSGGNPLGAGIGAALGTVMGIVENINFLFESAEARAQRLKEAATEANNTYLQKKNDYTSYKDEIDNLKKLEEARSDSEEAQKEYIETSNRIAEQHPELIVSYDDEGNAIIDLASSYHTLEKARQDAIEAGANAAQASINAAVDARKQAEKNLESTPAEARQEYFTQDVNRVAIQQQIKTLLMSDLDISDEELSLDGINTLNYVVKELSQGSMDFVTALELLSGELDKSLDENNLNNVEAYVNKVRSLDYESDNVLKYVDAIYAQSPDMDWLKTIINSASDLSDYENTIQLVNKNRDKLNQLAADNIDDTIISDFIIALEGYTGTIIQSQSDIKAAVEQQRVSERSGIASTVRGFMYGDEVDKTRNTEFFKEFDSINELISGYVYDAFEAFKEMPGVNPDTAFTNFVDSGKAQKAYQEIYDLISNIWSTATNSQKEQLNSLLKNSGQYSRAQFGIELQKIIPENNDELIEQLQEQYYNTAYNYSDYVNALVQRYQKQDFNLLGAQRIDLLKSLGGDELQTILGVYDKVASQITNKQISPEMGQNILDNYFDIWETTNQFDDTSREIAQGLLSSWDDFSLAGLNDFRKTVASSGLNEEQQKALIESAESFSDLIPKNFTTEIASFTQKITSNIEDFEKAISNAAKGMDLKTATEMAQKLGKSLGDFGFKDGKFFFDDFAAIRDAYLGENTELKSDIKEEARLLKEKYSNGMVENATQNLSIIFTSFDQGLRTIQDVEESLENLESAGLLNEAGFNKEEILQYYKEYQLSAERKSMSFVDWVGKNIDKQLAESLEAIDKYTNDQMARAALSTGNFSDFLDTIITGSGQTIEDYKYQLKTALTSGDIDSVLAAFPEYASDILKYYQDINKNVYNKLISGLDSQQYINADKFSVKTLQSLEADGLVEKISGEGSKAIYKTLDKMTNEQLDLFTQTITNSNFIKADKDKMLASIHAERYEDNLYSSLENVIKSYESASYDTIQSLANALNKTVDDLLGGPEGSIFRDMAPVSVNDDGTFKVNLERLDTFLTFQYNKLSDESYNKIRSQLEQAKFAQNTDNIIRNIINKREQLTNEDIGNLATALGEKYENLINRLQLQQNDDGTYRLNIVNLWNNFQNQMNDTLRDYVASEIDSVISSMTGLAGSQSKGYTDLASMQAYIKSLNQMNIINGKTGEAFTFNELFEYNDSLRAYQLSTEGIIAQIYGLQNQINFISDEQFAAKQKLMQETKHQFADLIDVDSLISAIGTNEYENIKNSFTKTVEDYNAVLQAMASPWEKVQGFDAEKLISTFEQGGMQAIEAMRQIAEAQGKQMTADQAEAAWRSEISRYVNAINTLVAKRGEIVDSATAEIINEAGGFASELGNSGTYLVQTAADLYKAYKYLLDKMRETGEATLADLNKVAGLMLDNKDGEQQVIDALGDAAGMTYTRFGEILAQQGKELSEDLINALEQSDIIKSLGGSRMMITDFSSFAEIMNWSADSEQYISAFKSYNDSLIQMNRQAENNILEEVKKVGEAKGGDWVNLTQLMSKMDDVTAVKLEATLRQFGGLLEDGILKLEPNANIPAIMQEIAQKAAESGGLLSDELAELADAVANTIKGYADLIKGAIKGSLTNVQAEQLQDWATQVGIGQLDFTPTKEGLKVATDQAMQLYQELSKIDNIQGQLVFDDLVSALSSDKGGRFENASATVAEIAKLNKEYEKNVTTIETLQETQKHVDVSSKDSIGKEISRLEEKNSKLKEQISLYREIQQAQSLDSSRYNFMNQDLPEMMQGPISYWNSWGKAFTAMNEAGQTGKMEIQDFYNIVGEMNNLMAASGETLQLGAHKLDGSAESAAALIEAGMLNLTNIDGKGVKINLKEIGVDFASGAEGMDTNLQDGIRTLAQSQIDMLDAAIKMLEVVVAMEDLGKIDVDDNGVFSIGDIFKLDENGNATDEYTKDYQDFAEKLIKQSKTNEDLKEALETIKVDGITLKEMFDDASNEVKKLNISRDTYFSIMEAFVKAFQSGDYDLDTIQDSVWDVLNELMPDGTTIDVGERTVIVSGGTKVQLDWESKNVKEALERVVGKDEEEKKQRLKELTAQYLNNEPISVEDTITVLIATNKITIEDNGTYTTEDGSTFTSPTEAVRYQQMKDIKADNLTAIHDDKGFFIGYEGELKVGDKILKVSNVGGRMLYHSDTLNQDFESLDELMHQEFLYARHYGFSGDEEDYAELVYGIKIKTRVKIENQEAWDNRTKGQNDELVNAILSGDMSKIKDTASEVGLTIKAESVSDMSQEEYNQLLELAGIENKTTIMNLQITSSESSDPRLIELVTSEGTITKEMEFDLTTTGDLSENFINAINNLNPANLMVVAFNLAAMSSSLKTISGATFQNVDDMKTRWDEILAVVKEVAEAIASIGDIKLPTPSGNSGGNDGGGKPEVVKPGQVSRRGTTDQATGGAVSAPGVGELTEKVGVLNTNATNAKEPVEKIATSLGSVQVDKAAVIETVTTSVNSVKQTGADNTEKFSKYVNEISSTGADNAGAFKKAVNDIPDKSGTINRLKNALDTLSGTLTMTVNIAVNVTGAGDAKGTIGDWVVSSGSGRRHESSFEWKHSGSYAKGNAYATGRKTLMGELGPELVVSHGRYFVVGQNGPEMVDLADDAIVFNHLQTRKLLANGKVSSHGSPVTNERNATSFATGNMEGDALASPSAALSALKQLRAMWQSMLEASLSDLGRTAGPGGGGGGGGSGGGSNDDNHAGFMKQIERWYNWLRRIEKAQDKINLLQKEYNLLTNDNVANGHKVYENIRDRIRALEEERKTHESLAASQREYYEQERARFEATGFDQLYDFNADGVLELRNDPTFDSERIRRQMEALGTQRFDGGGHLTVTRQGDNVRLSGQRVARDESGNVQLDDDGKVVLEGEKTRKFKIPTTGLELMNLLTQTTEHGNAKWSIEDQFMILRSLGFDKDLKYDENGNEVVKNLDNATVDEMRAAVEGWFAEADQWRDHFDGLDESIQEQTEAAMDNSAEIQRLQEELAKNELDLEKQIMNAVKDRRQAEIDNLQAQRDAFSEAADKMVNGLTEQLNKERQMYETSQNQNELEKLQRQLGILRRSGGSGSQIQSLQEQIRSKQQDIYFDERQQQIDAIKEASDKQLEKMDNQIDLMQRTLQYEEEHGLLWREVRDIMRETPAEIAEYIATYSSDYRASSALDQSRQTTATTESAQEYQASAIQPRAQRYVRRKKKYKGDIATAAENAYIESYTSATGGTEEERRAAAEAAADQAAAAAMDEAESNSAKQEFLAWTTKRGIPASEDSAYKKAEALFIKGYKNAKKDKKKAAIKKVQAVYDIVGEKGKKKFKKKKNSDTTTATNAYATGGLVNETGLAWLDGTKSKPEYVLSAKQTAFLRDELLNSRESMSGLVAELRQMFNGGENAVLSAVNNSTNNDEGIKIQHLDVNMNVASLGSDYDVEQAANAMFNKMTKIARKSGTRSVARR